jgi:exo-beta-1,3-glucanase (GH17 family)
MRQIPVFAFLILLGNILFSTAIRAGEPATITSLVMRDRIVVITNDTDGLKYSVKSKDGTVLSANITESELARKHPDVYEQVRPAYASDKNIPGLLMWVGDLEAKP